MEYFTYELWRRIQGPRSQKAQMEWEARASRYLNKVSRLRPRLGDTTYRFFRDHGLHDGFVRGIGDGGTRKLTLKVDQFGKQFRLEFDEVTSVSFVYRSKGEKCEALLEWGYEEFSRQGEQTRLEVLFSSGATLAILFRKLTVKRV